MIVKDCYRIVERLNDS